MAIPRNSDTGILPLPRVKTHNPRSHSRLNLSNQRVWIVMAKASQNTGGNYERYGTRA